MDGIHRVFTHLPRDSGLVLLGRCIVQKRHYVYSLRDRLNCLVCLLLNILFVEDLA